MSIPRLYCDQPLGPGLVVRLERAQAHYLAKVMRRKPGEAVDLFNGHDGDWAAMIESFGKADAVLRCKDLRCAQESVPDLWLLAPPLRKGRLEWIAEKACELGVARLLLTDTRRAVPESVRVDRLRAIVVEAAEQCGRTSLTAIEPLTPLAQLLDQWPQDRRLMFCDETGGAPVLEALAGQPRGGPWAILIGPEGGFDPAEQQRLAAMAQAVRVSLGPRILRADTAAVAAITCWQAALGDWR